MLKHLKLLLAQLMLLCFALISRAEEPIYIGMDADMSAVAVEGGQAIFRGASIAIEEINSHGGVLGRPLALLSRDHRGNPARGIKNLRHFAKQPDLVAVLGGVHTPVVLQELPIIHQNQLLFLVPWAAGTAIVDNDFSPNYVFRLSLRDQEAGKVIIQHAQKKKIKKVALVLERTGWGRSNQASLQAAAAEHNIEITGIAWINWKQTKFDDQINDLMRTQPEAIVLVTNAPEGAVVVNSLQNHPSAKALPVLSHWGIAGGNFTSMIDKSILSKGDISVLQTFHFAAAHNPKKSDALLARYNSMFDSVSADSIPGAVGVVHAYDLVHLLTLAIEKAGTIDRVKVRDAMEQINGYEGVVKHFSPPFTPDRHDALYAQDYMMTRLKADGCLHPIK